MEEYELSLMAKGKGKQRKRIRKRAWDAEHDVDTASREPRRVRGRETGVGAPVEESFDCAACFTEGPANGLVVSPYGVLAFVEVDGIERLCRVQEALTDGKTSFLAPGDRVVIEERDGENIVIAVRVRHTKLSRPAIERQREQVFAANIDQLVVVAAKTRPRFKPGVVDRYLIAAEFGGVSTVLCLNKSDLPGAEPE